MSNNTNRDFFNKQKYGEAFDNNINEVNNTPVKQTGPDEAFMTKEPEVYQSSPNQQSQQSPVTPTAPPFIQEIDTQKKRPATIIRIVIAALVVLIVSISFYVSNTTDNNSDIKAEDNNTNKELDATAIEYLTNKYSCKDITLETNLGDLQWCSATIDGIKYYFSLKSIDYSSGYADTLQAVMYEEQFKQQILKNATATEASAQITLNPENKYHTELITIDDYLADVNTVSDSDPTGGNKLSLSFFGKGDVPDDTVIEIATVMHRRCSIHNYKFSLTYYLDDKVVTKTIDVINGAASGTVKVEERQL